jgi:hypothetical protein
LHLVIYLTVLRRFRGIGEPTTFLEVFFLSLK